ncbi:esterase OVCA2-like isoform X5 [Trifolium pratense]|uniref:esterase OVCA2-like isoform X5 n=1 Tax=Trifolium pratense TaxID=57577 RepID=UPI001E693EBB|nr:esterase OVCA2-like isoform X5 [Trifolium pratense]XP_045809436.1 esterase OVCA2-like isoform X5 [Trifolium pratense]
MENQKRPRILCLHGYRTSGQILKKSIFSRWPETVTQKLDLVFLDGQCPARGKSQVEGIFDPPYYEWFQSNEDYTEYRNFEECIEYIEDYMLKNGPFDGVLGFSQGAMLAAVLPGMQAQRVALEKISKIKFVILISGAIFRGMKYGTPKLAFHAFSKPIDCPSLHIIGFLEARKHYSARGFCQPCFDSSPKRT